MSEPLRSLLALALVVAACGGGSPAPRPAGAPAPSEGAPAPSPAFVVATVPPAASPRPLTPDQRAAALQKEVALLIERISPERMWDHLNALTAVGSRDPRHPGHAKAVAYIKEQLGALAGVTVESQRLTYQGIPMENILAIVDPPAGPPKDGWVIAGAHYDSIAKATPGWRPSVDPAPGADDNATGTAALLEYARILAGERAKLRQRVVLAFWDGEELSFRGSAHFVQGLQKPYAYAAFVNVDMVGWNPVADRLDLIWYAQVSSGLRERAQAANTKYRIGVAPLVEVFAQDPQRYILDSAPFGLAGIPAITLAERYGEADATYPGNTHFHTVSDTPDKVTNRRLWLKAAKLTLAVALELALGDD